MPILQKGWKEIDDVVGGKTVDYFLMYDLDYLSNEEKFPSDKEVYVNNVFVFGYSPDGSVCLDKPVYILVDID